MTTKDNADSSAPIGCSPADGPLVPHNPERSPVDYVCPFCGADMELDIAWGYGGYTLTERYRCQGCGSMCDKRIQHSQSSG